jgi:hypothetical protein
MVAVDGVVVVRVKRCTRIVVEEASACGRVHRFHRNLWCDVGSRVGVGGRAVPVAGELDVDGRIRSIEESAPVVGDDRILIVLLGGVVATVKEVAPVVGDHIGSSSHGLGRNRDAPGCLPHVELVEELANGVEDELRVERHGDAVKLRKVDRGRKL